LHFHRTLPNAITSLFDLATKAFKGMAYRATECVDGDR